MATPSRAALALRAWRGELPQTTAAKNLGIDQCRLSQFELGARKPGLDLAGRIERETEGKVRIGDWLINENGTVRRRPAPRRKAQQRAA